MIIINEKSSEPKKTRLLAYINRKAGSWRDWVEYKNIKINRKKGLTKKKKKSVNKITSKEEIKEKKQQQHYLTLVHVKNWKWNETENFVWAGGFKTWRKKDTQNVITLTSITTLHARSVPLRTATTTTIL